MRDLPREMRSLLNRGKAYFTTAEPISLGYATHSRGCNDDLPLATYCCFLKQSFLIWKLKV